MKPLSQQNNRPIRPEDELWIQGMIASVFFDLRRAYPSEEYTRQLDEYQTVLSRDISRLVKDTLQKMALKDAFDAVHFLHALDAITDEVLYETMRSIWDAKISLLQKKALFQELKKLLWDYHEREKREMVETFERCLELSFRSAGNVKALETPESDVNITHSLEWIGESLEVEVWETIGAMGALEILAGENPHGLDYLAHSILIETGELDPDQVRSDPSPPATREQTNLPVREQIEEKPVLPRRQSLDELASSHYPGRKRARSYVIKRHENSRTIRSQCHQKWEECETE